MTLRTLFLTAVTGLALLSCSALSGETEIPNYTVQQADENRSSMPKSRRRARGKALQVQRFGSLRHIFSIRSALKAASL